MFETEIYDFAAGELGLAGEDQALMERLCAAAGGELLARLKEGVEPEAIKESFVTAAGVLALSMHCALGAKGENFSFKAGHLSVSRSGGKTDAESLRAMAEGLLAAYLKDAGFEFRSVVG